MKRLAVASGKGGTGKTFVSTNLAWYLAEAGYRVTYIDADVETPNGHLFLQPELVERRRFSVPVPAFTRERCSGCGACQDACAFNALVLTGDRVVIFPELCHGCGACTLACEERALIETSRGLGTLRRGFSGKIAFWSGEIDVGEARSTPLLAGLLEAAAMMGGDSQLTIIDVPPGTSCAASAAILGADRVLLVTEPTPFGLHDLKLAVEMCRALERPVAVAINRAGLGGTEVRDYINKNAIPLLTEIPYSPDFARAYATGKLAIRYLPSFRVYLDGIARHFLEETA